MEERGLGGASRLLRVCLHSWIQFGFFQALCCAVTEKHSNNEAGHQLSQNQTCLQAHSSQLGWSPELATITGTMVNWTHIWSACVTVWRPVLSVETFEGLSLLSLPLHQLLQTKERQCDVNQDLSETSDLRVDRCFQQRRCSFSGRTGPEVSSV